MELVKIEKLLDKYFDATTTLQEEKTLKDYFASSNVEPSLLNYKPMFDCFVSSMDNEISSDLLIKSMSRDKRHNRFRFVAVAASLVLIVSLFSSKYIVEKRQASKAYDETYRALSLVSEHLSKGNEAMYHLGRYEQVKNKIFKNK